MAEVKSSAIQLSDAQTNVLSTLVQLHNKQNGGPVKGKEVAEALDRNPGTIRTQMQSLKSLQLAKGVPGPKGGYEPTARAYEIIDLEQSDEYTAVPLRHDSTLVDGATVTEFDLINLHHPDQRKAEINVQGSFPTFKQGDSVTIGPTPTADIVVEGHVDGVDTTENVCIIEVEDLYFDGSGTSDAQA